MSQSCIIEELDQEQPASSGAATLSRASSNESYRSAGSDQAPAEQAEDSASAAKVPQEPKADGEDGHATEDFAEPAELTADELEVGIFAWIALEALHVGANSLFPDAGAGTSGAAEARRQRPVQKSALQGGSGALGLVWTWAAAII